MKTLVFLFAILAISQAAITTLSEVDTPDEFADQKGCYIRSINRVVPYDEPYYPIGGRCRVYVCYQGAGPNGSDLAQMHTCTVSGTGDNCVIIPGDKTKPYPQCCDGIRCSSHDEDEDCD